MFQNLIFISEKQPLILCDISIEKKPPLFKRLQRLLYTPIMHKKRHIQNNVNV